MGWDCNWYWDWGVFAIGVFVFLLGVLIGGTLREEKHRRERFDVAVKNTIRESSQSANSRPESETS